MENVESELLQAFHGLIGFDDEDYASSNDFVKDLSPDHIASSYNLDIPDDATSPEGYAITDLSSNDAPSTSRSSASFSAECTVNNYYHFDYSEENIASHYVAFPVSFSNQTHHDIYKPFSSNVFNVIAENPTSVNECVDDRPVLPPTQPVQRAVYKKVKGKSSQMCRIFPDILPVDNTRSTHQGNGKEQLWHFALQRLGDSECKSIIAWTGYQRQFQIKDTQAFCRLWSEHNERKTVVQWESLRRVIRTCGATGVLMAVPSTKHKGRNVDRLFAFVIEPAFYLNKTKEELDQFISENCENAPIIQLAQPSISHQVTDLVKTFSQLDEYSQYHNNSPNPSYPQYFYSQPQSTYQHDPAVFHSSMHHSNFRYQPY